MSGTSGHARGGTDSAGVPWAGRTLTPQPFAGDDGGTDPALAVALAGVSVADDGTARDAAGGADREAAVMAALAGTRLFVPVVAVLTEAAPAPADNPATAGVAAPAGEAALAGAGPTRRAVHGDKGADMAVMLRTRADGTRVLPVFTSAAALTAWDAEARPVPVEAERAALAAVAEGCDALALDEAGPVTFTVRRPALWALAQGRRWIPAPQDPEVAAAVRSACAGLPALDGVRCEPGAGAELRVVLGVLPGLDREGLGALLAGVQARLSADPVVAERVESLEVTVLPAVAV